MLHRFLSLQSEAVARAEKTKDGDLIVDMAFSSEEPYERWWGIEILDHSDGSIRLDRLNDGAALLFNHDRYDLRGTHIRGSARVDKDKVGRAKVQITSVTQAGRDTIGMVQTGVLSKTSTGYNIYKVIEQTTLKDGKALVRELDGRAFDAILTRQMETASGDIGAFRRALDAQFGAFERGEDDPTIYRIMDWEPVENSLVTIPADTTVGVGRSTEEVTARASRAAHPPAVSAIHRSTSMSTKTAEELAAEQEAARKQKEKEEREAREQTEREAREKLATRTALDLEKGRRAAITNLAKANKIPDNIRDAWVNQGYDLEQVSNDIIKILEERGKNNPQPASALGLSPTETQRFSFARAIAAIADGNWVNAGFELECSKALAQKLNRVVDPKVFLVPFEVLQRPVQLSADRLAQLTIARMMGQRDLTVATAGAGGFLVETENMGFIEILRNRSVAYRMGVRRLSGLQGSVTIPRQSAAATAVWLANEASTVTESQQTFVQVALTPKNVGAYTEISRQLLLQSSPGAEGIVTDDLAQVVALAADLAVLEGSGSGGQPTGISATSGIGSVTGTSIAYAGVLEFQTDVAGSNVMPARGGYVTTPAVAALLMQRARFSNTDTPLWVGNIWDGSVSGFPAMSSNQLTAASMIFGDWQETVVGEWGVLEVSVNPFANFQAGIIGVRAIYSMDVGVRRPFAFSRATSIT